MADSPPLAPHELYAYEPPVSLWGIVELYIPEHERGEVKNILGESLVEQSLELQQEVGTLLDIWRDFRSETENQPRYHRLPEPPAARDRLKQEIRFFVQNIREKSQDNGRDIQDVLSKHNKNVLDYVLENKMDDTSRPSTARSGSDGRATPIMKTTTPDRLCQSSIVCQDVESMQDQLNYLKLDEVVQHLRDTLENEVRWLLADIEFLQQCLDDEANFRCESSLSREPTLTDLREERTKLEKDLLSEDPAVPTVLRDRKQSPIIKSAPILSKGTNIKLRPTPPSIPSIPGPGRPSPIKATHQISSQVLSFPEKDSPVHRIHGYSKKSPEIQSDSDISSSGSPSPRTNSEHSAMTRKNSGSDTSPVTLPSRHRTPPDAASHLIIRTGVPSGAKVVQVGSIPVTTGDGPLLSPSPPSSAKPSSGRPGSAQRFRKMVIQCRDGE